MASDFLQFIGISKKMTAECMGNSKKFTNDKCPASELTDACHAYVYRKY